MLYSILLKYKIRFSHSYLQVVSRFQNRILQAFEFQGLLTDFEALHLDELSNDNANMLDFSIVETNRV